MLTFNQIYSESQSQIQDYDPTTLVTIKRAINQGMRKFGAILNRDWRNVERTFDVQVNQQFYQMPEDAIRIKTITITVGSIVYPLTEIVDQNYWEELNMRSQTSSVPQFFFVKGSDQFGIWPTPNATLAGGGILTFEKAMRDMTADDYTTGNIDVVGASTAVTGHSTTFTAAMKGRVLFVDPTNGTGDGSGYKIASYTSATSLVLENDYAGLTDSAKSYLIGEVPDIPEEFHEALVDYALYRAYRRRRDLPTAKDLKAAFDEQLVVCEENYSSKTSSQYFRAPRPSIGYRQFKRDLTIP